jgi:hypothetical protein
MQSEYTANIISCMTDTHGKAGGVLLKHFDESCLLYDQSQSDNLTLILSDVHNLLQFADCYHPLDIIITYSIELEHNRKHHQMD